MTVGSLLMAYDKWAAKHRPRARIPERTLLLVAALGGAPAMWATMYLCRHKTRHAKFYVGLPLLTAAHAALWLWIYGKGGVI